MRILKCILKNEGVGWIHLVQDRAKSQALMNTEINHHHYWDYSPKWALASFRILCHPTSILSFYPPFNAFLSHVNIHINPSCFGPC